MTSDLRIVLATDKSGYMAPIIPALTRTGAQIVAHIAPPRTWRKTHRGDWRFGPVLARHAPACQTLPFTGAQDWPQIIDQLDRLGPDLIVSAYFGARIPQAVLALARLGGVNLHPARLPWYAGAAPLHTMLLDGTPDRFGGMTLHVVAEAFDAGPIIGAATLSPDAWTGPARLNAALAGAGEALCAGPLQDWIAGRITPREQIDGVFPRAMLKDLGAIVPSEMTVDKVQMLLRFFRKGLPVATPDGPQMAGRLLRRLGPATQEPPQSLWPRRLRFDCADGRVETRHPLSLERSIYKATGRVPTSRPIGDPIAPEQMLDADQNADCIARMAACSPFAPGPTRSS